MNKKKFYRGKLPHFQPRGGTFFVTFRLYGSIPTLVLHKLKEEKRSFREYYLSISDPKNVKVSHFISKIDEYLAQLSNGPYWLAKKEIAETVSSSLHFWDKKRVDLICYCIMSNHVHAAVKVYKQLPNGEEYYLTDFMASVKKFSARRANIILNRTGKPFWEEETYDSLIRTPESLQNVITYIRQNPVKAGLVTQAQDWLWTYTNPQYYPTDNQTGKSQ
ncbi:MAG: transposase [Bacteroidia bacterium]